MYDLKVDFNLLDLKVTQWGPQVSTFISCSFRKCSIVEMNKGIVPWANEIPALSKDMKDKYIVNVRLLLFLHPAEKTKRECQTDTVHVD